MKASELFANILIGVDRKGVAAPAVVRGALLERQLGSRLSLVHAVEVPPALWPGVNEDKLAEMHATALEHARRDTLSCLNAGLRGADIDSRIDQLLSVIPGHPAPVILSGVQEHAADLVVLGPHSKRSAFEFGGATRAILPRLQCPLWVQGEPVDPIRQILVAIDFSEHSRGALHCARDLAARLTVPLVVQHCFLPSNATGHMAETVVDPNAILDEERRCSKRVLQRWMDSTDWGGVAAEALYTEDETIGGILRAAESADLIVVGTHGRTGLSRFLMGSTARGLLAHSQKPVLVIPRQRDSWLL